jgi:hypothetical protein
VQEPVPGQLSLITKQLANRLIVIDDDVQIGTGHENIVVPGGGLDLGQRTAARQGMADECPAVAAVRAMPVPAAVCEVVAVSTWSDAALPACVY